MTILDRIRPRDRSEWAFFLGGLFGAPVVSIIARYIDADGSVSLGRAAYGAAVAAVVAGVLALATIAAFRYAESHRENQNQSRRSAP